MAPWRLFVPVSMRALRAVLLAGALGVLSAGLAHGQGDGSVTNNPDLLRGSFSPFCEPAMLCSVAENPPPPVPAPVASMAPEPLAPAAPAPLDNPAPVPAALPSAPMAYPLSPSSPWRAGYGIALRGAFVHARGANRYEALLIPNASLRYSGAGTEISLSGDATLVQGLRREFRIGGATLDGSLAHALGPTTRLGLEGAVALERDDPQGLDVTSSGVATAPLRLDASLQGALTQQLGLFDLTGTLALDRGERGGTRLASGGVLDNSGENRTRFSGGMRLGYALTPLLGVFVAGEAGRDEFDAVDPALGVRRSGWTYAARAGATANWQERATLEASIGTGWRTYDASLPDTRSLLYGLALGYNPDPTLRLRAALDTEIAPGTGSGAASTDYTLSLEAAYKVNQWLGLRGTASGSWSEAQGTGALTRRYTAGLGADLVLGPHSDFALDYRYGWRNDPAATPREADEHRVSAGVSLQY